MNTRIFGTWSVTTEADCEGRTDKSLGIHQGWVDDIALTLQDKAMYSLFFKLFDPNINFDHDPRDGSVSVVLHNQDTKNLNDIQEAFIDRPVQVSKGQYYNSFIITSKPTLDVLKERALRKLSDEEKQVLGLIESGHESKNTKSRFQKRMEDMAKQIKSDQS